MSNFSTKRKLNKFASDLQRLARRHPALDGLAVCLMSLASADCVPHSRTAKAIPGSSISIIISLNKLFYKILQLFAFFYNNLL